MAKQKTDYNVELTVVDTEYKQKLPPGGTQKIMIQARTNAEIRYSFTEGKVAGSVSPYNTLKAGRVYYENDLTVHSGMTLFLASSVAGIVVEVNVWQ